MTDTEQLVEVRIVGLPIDVYRESQEHVDELLREFALIRERDPDDSPAVPRRLLDLVDRLTVQFSGFTAAQEAQLRDAVEHGHESIDLVYRVPRETKEAVIALGAMLDDADAFCRSGKHLLTLTTPPRAVAFRQWFLDEFTRQIEGGEPRPWQAAG